VPLNRFLPSSRQGFTHGRTPEVTHAAIARSVFWTRRVTSVARKCHLGCDDSRTVEFAPENDDCVMSWLRRGGSAGRISQCGVEVDENTAVIAVLQDPEALAGRQGFLAAVFSNPNKDGAFALKACAAIDLALSDSCVGFRPFASVVGFYQRNDTRNVTRLERLPSSSRRKRTRANFVTALR